MSSSAWRASSVVGGRIGSGTVGMEGLEKIPLMP
jgi:hypothetical protein